MDLDYQFRWQRVAHRIIDELVHQPSTTLPGMRVLAEQYQSSVSTIEQALNHLEEMGITEPVQHGKKRQVNLPKLRKIASLQGRMDNRILFLATVDHSAPLARAAFEQFLELCDREGLSLDYIQIPTEPSEVHELLTAIQPRGIILFGVPGPIEKLAASLHIPSVWIGTRIMRPFHVPGYYYVDISNLFSLAFQRAWAAGHRRIVAPMVTPHFYYDKFAAEIKKEYPGGAKAFSKRYNLPIIESVAATDYIAGLREIFRYTPPTCLILYDVSHYLVVTSFLLEKRLRIPDDISVILLTADPLLDDIIPTIDHCTLFTDGMEKPFNLLKEQMNGLQSSEQISAEPTWVPGGSLAAPKTP